MSTRKHLANGGIIGLVGLEVIMGTASLTPQVPPIWITVLMVLVLAIGSVLQATLMEISLYHRRHENWRQWPAFAIQATLFLMIAWWAHKGLGNTIFVGLPEWQLITAGLGLGLLTMFGPEVVNHEHSEMPTNRQEGTATPVSIKLGTLTYRDTIKPAQQAANGHIVDLERAVAMVEN